MRPPDFGIVVIYLKQYMKKSYILLAVMGVILIAGLGYFMFSESESSLISIKEGIQGQVGDLRIGVSYIKENPEFVDSDGNKIENPSASAGPAAGLALADPESEAVLNVVIGDQYTFGKYEIFVKNIVLGTDNYKGSVALRVTSAVDKNPVIMSHVVSLPPADTKEKKVAYAFSYLDLIYGEREIGWNYVSADSAVIGNRVYDAVTIELADGSEELIHFDITDSLRQIVKKDIENLGGITFSKNKGTSVGDAIIIKGAEGEKDGIDSEYKYLEAQYGLRGIDWELTLQSLLKENGRDYDQMDIKLLNDGTEITVYFDISEFFGINNF